MKLRSRIDRRALGFGLSGFASGCLALTLGFGGVVWSLAVVLLGRGISGERVRAAAFGIGSLAPVAALALSLFGLAAYDDWRLRVPFDSSLWAQTAQARADRPLRLGMVDDLLARRALDGLDRYAVLDLLGPPDLTRGDRNTQIWYRLGIRRGHFDSEWLMITFNGQDRVQGFERTH
jgi:hypothetical protein